ncbi:MAG TPA: STAS domain-containing protein [Baekduia sp.]|nr:STAS domain-containing protein [Baekduia sp.]
MDLSPQPFSVSVAEQDGTCVVRARGELDLSTAPEVEAAVLPLLRHGRRVVLDLRDLDFLDSSGIRMLVVAHDVAAKVPEASFGLVRLAPESHVWHALEVSGVDQVLDLVELPA